MKLHARTVAKVWLALAMVMALSPTAVGAQTPPPPPWNCKGRIYVDLSDPGVPGTSVAAYIDGRFIKACNVYTWTDEWTWYSVEITSAEGGYENATVRFWVTTSQTSCWGGQGTWHSWGIDQVDLYCSTPTSTPAPTSTPTNTPTRTATPTPQCSTIHGYVTINNLPAPLHTIIRAWSGGVSVGTGQTTGADGYYEMQACCSAGSNVTFMLQTPDGSTCWAWSSWSCTHPYNEPVNLRCNIPTPSPTGTTTPTPTETGTPTISPTATETPRATTTSTASPTPSGTPLPTTAPTAVNISPTDGGTLWTNDHLYWIVFPPMSVFTNAVAEFVPLPLPIEGQDDAALRHFRLWMRDLNGLPITNLRSAAMIVLWYRDSEVAGLDEEHLVLRYYDPTTRSWVDIPTGHNMSDNAVWALLTHLTDFGLFVASNPGPASHVVHLPIIVK
ncbi:MAG: hypothetical protein H5T64_00740 [Chloroflexi bacterium]|nr:hypothetical protein [Chloroflexota bacterium]